jgi:hypothetical protein
VVGSNYPPDFYVPTTGELRQATLRLGEAPRFADRACTVAVAPTPLVCVDRFLRSDWRAGTRRSSLVSGEPIVLAGDANGNTARLVRATARVGDVDLGPHALVGGLAVMCRLAAVHRATQDVDTVTETTAPTAVEVTATSLGQRDPSSPSRAVVDGISIDVIGPLVSELRN